MSRKAEAKKNFDGSPHLFESCWRKLLSLEKEGFVVDEVDADICRIASDKVNDESSPFWMRG